MELMVLNAICYLVCLGMVMAFVAFCDMCFTHFLFITSFQSFCSHIIRVNISWAYELLCRIV